MTIKEFSNLCGCNPQTIRYYDRMNLLKPVKVDDWTGFANTIMGMLILKNKGRKRELGCKVDSSQDGENHFWMLKRKSNGGE